MTEKRMKFAKSSRYTAFIKKSNVRLLILNYIVGVVAWLSYNVDLVNIFKMNSDIILYVADLNVRLSKYV